MVAEDRYTSIHIEELVVMARDTKLGAEEITRDIPNLSEQQLNRLDESGIIYVGAEVQPGDTLVARSRPRAKPRSRLKRSCAPSSARRLPDVKDTSLRAIQGLVGHRDRRAGVHREGIQRDKRAQQIIDDELKRFRLGLNDQLRIVEADAFDRIEKLLTGRVANGGPRSWPRARRSTRPTWPRSRSSTGSTSALPKTKSRPSSNPSRTRWSKPATASTWLLKKSAKSSRKATSCLLAC